MYQVCHNRFHSHTSSSPLLEEDAILSITRGTQGRIREKAHNLGILPTPEIPTYLTNRYVPWVNGTLQQYSGAGVTDFLYSVYMEGVNTFQIVNNTDSILYITGGVPVESNLIAGPEAILGPFKGANLTLSSSSVTILSRCYGYDFTSTRAIRGFLDTRGPSAYVDIRGIKPNDNPPLPVLRSTWLRFYDLFDLTLANPLPVNQITNTSWFSFPLDFSGGTSAQLNVVATANHIPTSGSELMAYLSFSGIATGMGNWNAGGTILTTVVGNNYITNAPLILSANKPQLELFFLPGDLTGTVVNYIDLWIAAEVAS